MRGALLLAALLVAGCMGQRVEAPVPPESYQGDGPPALPAHAADAATRQDRRFGGCAFDAAFAWPQGDARFDVTVPAGHEEAWMRANVTLWVNGTTRVELAGAPVEGGFVLASSQQDFVRGLRPGAYTPWSLGVDVRSDDPAIDRLQPLGKPALHGWLLVTRGSDDKLWVYLEGARLPEDPFPAARLLGGTLFVSPHGVCP